jgi:hypothetical protein
LTPSADEVREALALAPQADVRAVPLYSVPTAPIARRADPAEFAARRVVLFVGGYAHPPNVDAALFLASEVMPLVWETAPQARLVLAGSKPTPELLALAGERIEVPGWVPDLGPFYARARLSVTPVRYGAGVKGKVIGSLQAGVPVVTTSVGNEGLGLRNGVEALVADAPRELAEAVLALFDDPARCASLAEFGAAFLRRRFGEEVVRRSLMDVLGRDVCPVCGRRIETAQPVLACEACDATHLDRALAEVLIQPLRRLRIGSLREGAPMFAAKRVRLPAGPMRQALGEGVDGSEPLDVLVTSSEVRTAQVRPGGRWLFPAPGAPDSVVGELMEAGWTIRLHEAGPPVVEAQPPSLDPWQLPR